MRRSPRRLRPYSRIILVLVPASSRKIRRCGCSRMTFWRRHRSCLAFRTRGPVALPGDQAFFICVAVATQEPINATGRTLHIMGSQKSGPKPGKRDVRILLNQLHKERQEDSQPATALTRPRSQRLKGLAIPDPPAPTRRRSPGSTATSCQPPPHKDLDPSTS